jgi:hypothetical protein
MLLGRNERMMARVKNEDQPSPTASLPLQPRPARLVAGVRWSVAFLNG